MKLMFASSLDAMTIVLRVSVPAQVGIPEDGVIDVQPHAIHAQTELSCLQKGRRK
jgi:hypothetical protein